jgi:molybdopterin-guanine dinucleotide biosynthesis protein A
MAISAIILAGGSSSRMGRDKASLPFGAETMLERVVRLVRGEADLVIVAGRAGQAVPDGVTLVVDEEEGRGPLPALVRALGLVETSLTLVLACDMPLIEPAVLGKLITLIDGVDAVVPSTDGHMMTTCAVLRTDPAREAAARSIADDERSLRAFLRRLEPRVAPENDFREVDPDLRSFVACNTPADYRQALVLAGLETAD